MVLVGLSIWGFSSLTTEGLIDKRYANQDALGREKADVTTGRAELIESELQAFYDHPITGIGVGKNKEYRLETIGELSATHNEVSRMLAEHGLLGVIALGILGLTPLLYRIRNRTNVYLFSFLIFWFLTINHSSMRIAAPAFIYGLSLITIIHGTHGTRIHRQ
jgi:O-antigen ligase